MQTHNAKRVAIIVESPMQRRLTDAIEASGVTGYTVVPVIGGSGRSGAWTAEGQVSRAGGMVQVICVIRPERLDDLLKYVFEVVKRHIGVVTVSDCQVLRAERF